MFKGRHIHSVCGLMKRTHSEMHETVQVLRKQTQQRLKNKNACSACSRADALGLFVDRRHALVLKNIDEMILKCMKLYRSCQDKLTKDSRTKALVAHAQEQTPL